MQQVESDPRPIETCIQRLRPRAVNRTFDRNFPVSPDRFDGQHDTPAANQQASRLSSFEKILMESSKRKICQAVAFVISTIGASAAMAQTAPPLLGGGSSLVTPLISTEILPANFPVADGSIAYWSASSGLGQTAFLTNDATKFTAVGAGSMITASGPVDFANSDAPLSSAQISAYTSTGGLGVTHGPLIQIPYVVTPITIPLVNAPTGTGPKLVDPNNSSHLSAPMVALNDDDLCGIFSGKLTNWNQVVNPDITSGASTYTLNAPITVVYRADNSGTTDLLTAHLAQVCHTTPFVRNGVTVAANSNISFSETQNFAGLFTAGVPWTFKSATGSGGVAASLLALAGAGISYLSPAYTNTFLAPSSAPAQINNLSVASLRNATTNQDVAPTYRNATVALGTVTVPTGANAADPRQWVPQASNPTTGYPVSGTSQIILSQCYANTGSSPSVAASVVDFLNLHYFSNAAIIHGNGFDTVPSVFSTAIKADFLTPGSGLNIKTGGAVGPCRPYAGR
ncbi:substrate-binding domain-containing protein [Burkholderia sp. JKS000303]|uniref:substrate-binding domain-containing protein n=1 Tax=Burkholderia sp. JKS000303 TaxID=1938747 RepID=UPI00211D374E|nr:substrate-binding domain-containing protein [Burkholderia sp. JKS000303]